MAPELVEEFTRAFHTEVDKQRSQEDAEIEQTKRELKKISDKLEGLYDAIADGLRTPGLESKLEKLETEKKDLELRLDQASPALPRIHPNLAVLYKQKVEKLYEALSDPEVKTEAAEILNSLIDRINLSIDKSKCYIELIGDIVKLITLPEGSDVPASFES